MLFFRKFSAGPRLFQWPTDKTGAPLNVFLAYVKRMRPQLREDEAHRYKKSREREAVISEMWKTLDPQEKHKMQEEYRKAKWEYARGLKG